MLGEAFNRFSSSIPHVEGPKIELLERHFVLLKKWNRSMSLVSEKSLENAFSIHYVDSLFQADFAVHRVLQEFSINDIGTGAGFPGMVAAIQFPDRKFTLYEANERKRAFLNICVSTLNLKNVTLEGSFSRGKEIGLFFARAVAPAENLFERLKSSLLQGSIVAYSGAKNLIDIGLEKIAESDYTLPENTGVRRVILYKV